MGDVSALDLTEDSRLLDLDDGENHSFGGSVTISRDTVVVGA
jgi:hypothetical protein